MDHIVARPADSQDEPASAAPLPFKGPRVPLPGPDDDVRPAMGLTPPEQRYLQGTKLPATSSVLISTSKYLNNPYYREAYATQALRRHGPDLPTTYMVPPMIRAIEEVTDIDRVADLIAEEKKINPAFGAWVDERRFTVFTPRNTHGYDEGTLGRAIYDFVNIPGMDMEFLSREKGEVKSDLEYIIKRRVSLHDIDHMITGFGPNTAGECALGMVIVMAEARYFTPELAQWLSGQYVWITSTGYNRTAVHYHHALPTYLDAMQMGINVGKALHTPLFLYQWEDFLEWKLDDIAAHLGFTRGPGDAWAWTDPATQG